MRSSRLDGKLFFRFDKDFIKEHVLALIQSEDVVVPYALDDAESDTIDELCRYCDEYYGEGLWKMIGTYRESGFRGFKLAERHVPENSRYL